MENIGFNYGSTNFSRGHQIIIQAEGLINTTMKISMFVFYDKKFIDAVLKYFDSNESVTSLLQS